MGDWTCSIEPTLTNRDSMVFPMLVGSNGSVDNRREQAMRIAMLARNANLFVHRRLVEANEAQGHEVGVFDTFRDYMNISTHRPDIRYGGKTLRFAGSTR